MARLAEAEKKLHDAIAALEAALTVIPAHSPAEANSDSAAIPDTASIIADIAAIDDKIEQAMKLVAKAGTNKGDKE